MHGYMRRCSLSLTHTQAPRTNHVKGQLCLMSLAHQATVSSVAKLGGPPERRRYAQQGRCSALRPALPHLGELPVGKRELKALPNDLRLPLSHAGRLPKLLQLLLHIGQPLAHVVDLAGDVALELDGIQGPRMRMEVRVPNLFRCREMALEYTDFRLKIVRPSQQAHASGVQWIFDILYQRLGLADVAG